jgi:hypothetical protein
LTYVQWERAFRERRGEWWDQGPDDLQEAIDILPRVGADDPRRLVAENLIGTVGHKRDTLATRAVEHGNVEEDEAFYLIKSLTAFGALVAPGIASCTEMQD